jgi:dienelactone hydrolase
MITILLLALAAPPDTVRFTDPGPVSELTELTRRDPVLAKDVREYRTLVRPFRLAKERFTAVLPDNYDGKRPVGLLVWIDVTSQGEIPKYWRPALSRQGLIVVGAKNAGNRRTRWERYQLALAAAHAAKGRWRIDPKRIYVGGFSGGGRSASWLSLHYPDVFRGGLMMAGANTPDGRKMGSAQPEYAEFARSHCRYVYLTGQNDPNLAGATRAAAHLRGDKYRHVHELQIPKTGHAHPSGPWLKKALDRLDPN